MGINTHCDYTNRVPYQRLTVSSANLSTRMPSTIGDAIPTAVQLHHLLPYPVVWRQLQQAHGQLDFVQVVVHCAPNRHVWRFI